MNSYLSATLKTQVAQVTRKYLPKHTKCQPVIHGRYPEKAHPQTVCPSLNLPRCPSRYHAFPGPQHKEWGSSGVKSETLTIPAHHALDTKYSLVTCTFPSHFVCRKQIDCLPFSWLDSDELLLPAFWHGFDTWAVCSSSTSFTARSWLSWFGDAFRLPGYRIVSEVCPKCVLLMLFCVVMEHIHQLLQPWSRIYFGRLRGISMKPAKDSKVTLAIMKRFTDSFAFPQLAKVVAIHLDLPVFSCSVIYLTRQFASRGAHISKLIFIINIYSRKDWDCFSGQGIFCG